MVSKKGHEFVTFRYLEMHGRMKRAPLRREELLLIKAFNNIGLVYRRRVVFINPLYGGYKNLHDAVPQWLDFCIFYGKMYVILFDLYRGRSGPKKREKDALKAKTDYLEQRGIEYLILSRKETSQIYEFRIKKLIGGRI